MKKQITFLLFTLLFALTSSQVMAQKNVLYILTDGIKVYDTDGPATPVGSYFQKQNTDASYGIETKSSHFGDDPVLKMLLADSNLNVVYVTIKNGTAPANIITYLSGTLPATNTMAVTTDVDFTGFDLVIAAECLSSSSNLFNIAGGKLLPNALTTPVIYNEVQHLINGKMVTSAAASNWRTQNLSVTVQDASNPVFTGLGVSNGSEIPLFKSPSDDWGAATGPSAIEIVNGLEISSGSTLLATVPEISNTSQGIVLNYFSTNDKVGNDATGVFAQPAYVLPFSWGPTVKQNGGNITSELLTIWRNAIYSLTGLTNPGTLVPNPAAAGYELVTHTQMYDFTDGSFLGSVVADGTPLASISHISSVDGITQLNKVNATTTSQSQFDCDYDNPLNPTKNIRVYYIEANGDNFKNSTLGINLKEGARVYFKAYGSATITIPLVSDTNLDFNVSASNINKNAWAEVNGVNLNGNYNTGVTFNDVVTAGTTGNYVIKTFAATNKGTDFNFYPAANGGTGTDSYIPYIKMEYSLLQAKPKQILYLNQIGVGQGTGASAPGQDPVIKMLQADPNFVVTYLESDQAGTQIPALSGFDLVIAQETFSSGAALFKPGGKLGLKDVTIPIIYNKSYAFRNGRAVTDADATVPSPQTDVTVTVDPANQSNPLFKGINFSGGNTFNIFGSATASDNGTAGGGTKAIDAVINLDITAGGESLATTSYATNPATSMVINYLPSGTQLGTATTDKLTVNAVALSFSYGATIMGDGTNISPEALTIWRNAAYMLTGLSVPSTLVANPNFTLGIDKAGDVSNVSSNVISVGKRIYVTNVKSATEVNIYSITGALVKSFKTNNDIDFEFKTGLWIATVKTFEGEKAVKLLTR